MTHRRLLRACVVLTLPLAFAVGACSENLETGAACPTLCPGQQLDIIDTVIDPAIVLDTTLGPYPFIGYEPALLLASRGDTADVRAVIRFDTLARFYQPRNVDTIEVVTHVDSATLEVQMLRTRVPLPATFDLEVYDVGDSTLVDSIPATLVPLFTPERFLGHLSIDSADFADTATYQVPLDSAKLRAMLQDTLGVVRLGLRVRSAESVQVLVRTSQGAIGPARLNYRLSADTAIPPVSVPPSSITPRTPLFVAGDYLNYPIVAVAPPVRASQRFGVGGMPGVRSYLRFDLPNWLTDSVAVLRAQLEMVQEPIPGMNPLDSLTVFAQLVIANSAVTDLRRAGLLLAPEGTFIRDTMRLSPADSGLRTFELNGAIPVWRTVDGVRRIPAAIIIRSTSEALSLAGARFYGLHADPTLRPRLRISYVPPVPFGQP